MVKPVDVAALIEQLTEPADQPAGAS
jgi:hypothetical protein